MGHWKKSWDNRTKLRPWTRRMYWYEVGTSWKIVFQARTDTTGGAQRSEERFYLTPDDAVKAWNDFKTEILLPNL